MFNAGGYNPAWNGPLDALACPSDAYACSGGQVPIPADYVSGGTNPEGWNNAVRCETNTRCSYNCSGADYANYYSWTNNRAPFGTSSESRAGGYREWKTFSSVIDGLSNTVFMGECIVPDQPLKIGNIIGSTGQSMINNPAQCLNYAGAGRLLDETATVGLVIADWYYFGRHIFCAMAVYNHFFTILPPNSPSCSKDGAGGGPVVSAVSSYHAGGANVVMGDGTVRFISDTIECGDSSFFAQGNTAAEDWGRTGESPYGIWGALGSINGGENKSL